MSVTQESLTELFLQRRTKKELLTYVANNPGHFNGLVFFSLNENTQIAWRCSWLIGHVMERNDPRVVKYVSTILDILPKREDGHQRQLLIILEKIDINDNFEGKVFDICLNIWEDIKKIPSTRVTALKILLKIAEKYPELINEVELWTQGDYIKTLSPGIKNSVLKMRQELLNVSN